MRRKSYNAQSEHQHLHGSDPQLLAGALPILEAWPALTEVGVVPLIRPDLRGRRDIRDLIRVHQLEGDGEATSAWHIAPMGPPHQWLAMLEVTCTRPARCDFALLFQFSEHAALLGDIASAGKLGITMEKPRLLPEGAVLAPTMVIDGVPPHIADALTMYALAAWAEFGH